MPELELPGKTQLAQMRAKAAADQAATLVNRAKYEEILKRERRKQLLNHAIKLIHRTVKYERGNSCRVILGELPTVSIDMWPRWLEEEADNLQTDIQKLDQLQPTDTVGYVVTKRKVAGISKTYYYADIVWPGEKT